MDFRNINPLNVSSNIYVSGNLLPLKPHDSQFSIASKLYSALMWLIQVAEAILLVTGFMAVGKEKAFSDGLFLTAVLTTEVFFIAGRVQANRKLVYRLIQELNDILQIEDEIMKNIVTETVKPIQAPLKYYSVAGAVCVFIWFSLRIPLAFEKSSFLYEDFRMPVAFSKQPFSTLIFVLGSILLLIGNVHIFLKKCGLYIYIIHFVLIITAQYRYIAKKLAMIFREAGTRCQNEKVTFETDQWAGNALKKLCDHHANVLRLSNLLREILSSSLSMLYVNSVLRFCFTAVLLSSVISTTLVEFLLISIYSSGSIVEFYMLCSCMQHLQDASTEISDEAFHEKWYQFGPSVKRTFMLMIFSNNLGCKLSSCDKLTLSLSSFMTILNQAYSVAVILL